MDTGGDAAKQVGSGGGGGGGGHTCETPALDPVLNLLSTVHNLWQPPRSVKSYFLFRSFDYNFV